MAKRTTTQKAPEEEPQLAEATKREVVDITGNVVRAPELRHTSGGKAICNVRLAVDGDDGQTRWYTVTAWEHLAEAVSAHVKKGDALASAARSESGGGPVVTVPSAPRPS
jgi:hypothetical protein